MRVQSENILKSANIMHLHSFIRERNVGLAMILSSWRNVHEYIGRLFSLIDLVPFQILDRGFFN